MGEFAKLVVALAVLLGTATVAQAESLTLPVPGTSDPWLAGMPDGATASNGDVAPQHSPVEVTGITLVPGTALTFGVEGLVRYGPSSPWYSPDGGEVTSHAFYGAQNGISNIFAPTCSLVGVFMDSARPDLAPAPAALDFSSNLDFSGLSPQLKQVFFIGDGATSANTSQQFIVPSGATRLFLGTMDGWGWFNNQGSFTVQIHVVPEPSTLCLVSIGAIGLAVGAWRESKRGRGWLARQGNGGGSHFRLILGSGRSSERSPDP